MRLLKLVLVMLGTSTRARGESSEREYICASPCSCLWKMSRNIANCANHGLSDIPLLPGDVQTLDLSGSNMSTVAMGAFRNVGLHLLKRINLRHSHIEVVHPNAFSGLYGLIQVDLSFNCITSLPQFAFPGNKRLRQISLNNNPLDYLINKQFSRLPCLIKLGLRNCKLSKIHPLAFQGIGSVLEVLDLRNNYLFSLPLTIFKILPKLKVLLLSSNPWNCDCNLKSFLDWYVNTLMNVDTPKCIQPLMFLNMSWGNVLSDDFHCPPMVTLSGIAMYVGLGKNHTISCLSRGKPRPILHWRYNNKPLDCANVDIATENYWSNLTLLNTRNTAAGDYTCVAENDAGYAEGTIIVGTLIDGKWEDAVSNSSAPLWGSMYFLIVTPALLIFGGLISFKLWQCLHKRREMTNVFINILSLDLEGSLRSAIHFADGRTRRETDSQISNHVRYGLPLHHQLENRDDSTRL